MSFHSVLLFDHESSPPALARVPFRTHICRAFEFSRSPRHACRFVLFCFSLCFCFVSCFAFPVVRVAQRRFRRVTCFDLWLSDQAGDVRPARYRQLSIQDDPAAASGEKNVTTFCGEVVVTLGARRPKKRNHFWTQNPRPKMVSFSEPTIQIFM